MARQLQYRRLVLMALLLVSAIEATLFTTVNYGVGPIITNLRAGKPYQHALRCANASRASGT